MASHVKTTDMNEQMRDEAVSTAEKALMTFGNDYEQLAKMVKEHFDANHGLDGWQCHVGTNFGAKVTHEETTFIRMKLGKHCELILFKTKM